MGYERPYYEDLNYHPSYYVKPKFVDFSGFSQIFSSYNRAIGDEQSLYLVLIS